MVIDMESKVVGWLSLMKRVKYLDDYRYEE